jgi:hypothetical protein
MVKPDQRGVFWLTTRNRLTTGKIELAPLAGILCPQLENM